MITHARAYPLLHLSGETEYEKKELSGTDTSHVLFSAKFANDTPTSQTYTLRTERRTKSICQVNFTKTFTYGAEVRLRIGPPLPIIEANAGFKADFSNTNGTFIYKLRFTK